MDIKRIERDIKFNSWLKIMHYIEIENTQGDITDFTYNTLSDALLDIKPDVIDEEEDDETYYCYHCCLRHHKSTICPKTT